MGDHLPLSQYGESSLFASICACFPKGRLFHRNTLSGKPAVRLMDYYETLDADENSAPFTFVLPTGRIGSHQWVTMVGEDIL